MSFSIYMDEMSEVFNTTYKAHQDGIDINSVKKYIPKKIGKGYSSIKPLGDMLFSKQSYHFNQDIEILQAKHGNVEDYYFLMFTLEGDNHLKITNQKKNYPFIKNIVNLGLSAQCSKYSIQFKKNTTIQYSFCFSKETLLSYLIEFDNTTLIKKVDQAKNFNIFNTINLSPSHHYLIEKMRKNPYHGNLRQLYFETCANELLITLLQDLSCKKVYNLALDENDKEQLLKARAILIQDIQNPPTIDQLSKMVSINQDKLKKGFKILFGNTIFKTLTQERMKIAYVQLQNNHMNVGEVAYDYDWLGVLDVDFMGVS